jgi:hypothetical protein
LCWTAAGVSAVILALTILALVLVINVVLVIGLA